MLPAAPRAALPVRALDPRRFHQRLLAASAVLLAGSLAAGTGISAGAATADGEVRDGPAPQSMTVAQDALAQSIVRDELTVTWSPPVVYPVGTAAPMGSGFGYRAAPCAGCSSNHQGVDWNPGSGTPITAMADGVVVGVGDPEGAYGVWIEIEHVVNGQRLTTLSAHMQYGSLRHGVGDVVEVGEVVGAVGSTGASTGAHLHFEVRIDGVAVDPAVWLRANYRETP